MNQPDVPKLRPKPDSWLKGLCIQCHGKATEECGNQGSGPMEDHQRAHQCHRKKAVTNCGQTDRRNYRLPNDPPPPQVGHTACGPKHRWFVILVAPSWSLPNSTPPKITSWTISTNVLTFQELYHPVLLNIFMQVLNFIFQSRVHVTFMKNKQWN